MSSAKIGMVGKSIIRRRTSEGFSIFSETNKGGLKGYVQNFYIHGSQWSVLRNENVAKISLKISQHPLTKPGKKMPRHMVQFSRTKCLEM
jgi:hypothetical protein